MGHYGSEHPPLRPADFLRLESGTKVLLMNNGTLEKSSLRDSWEEMFHHSLLFSVAFLSVLAVAMCRERSGAGITYSRL